MVLNQQWASGLRRLDDNQFTTHLPNFPQSDKFKKMVLKMFFQQLTQNGLQLGFPLESLHSFQYWHS